MIVVITAIFDVKGSFVDIKRYKLYLYTIKYEHEYSFRRRPQT